MKNKKIIPLFCVVVAVIIIIIICIFPMSAKGPQAMVLPTTSQQSMPIQKTPITTVDYNLGKGFLKTPGKVDMPYMKQGVLSIPTGKGGPYPLVVIIHGRHGIRDYEHISEAEKYYKGFTYLTQSLAKEKYAVISIDVNPEQYEVYKESIEDGAIDYGNSKNYERLISIYKAHLSGLAKAVKRETSNFKVDLKNKINLNDVTLIGHSRGGQGIDFLATSLKKEGNKSIKGMISLAPSKNLPNAPYTDVPHGFIIPEYDFDVDTLEGQISFDELKVKKGRKSWANDVFLRGANHYYFSRKLDLGFTPNVPSDNVLDKNTINRKQHETFLTNYAAEFLGIIHGKQKPKANFNANGVAPQKMYGLKVMSSMYTPKTKQIFTADKKIQVKTSDMKSKYVVESVDKKRNTAGYFKHPIETEFNLNGPNLNLLNMQWTNKKGKATLPMTTKDFSKFRTVRLLIAQDSTNKINRGKDQAFTLVFTDKKGKQARIILSNNTPALSYLYGVEETSYTTEPFWLGYTPLTDVRIPLALLTNVNKSEIQSIGFEFNQTNAGSIMLREMVLQ
ncbi:alpha/beta hydrolase [Paenilisteria newyorkensis]|uniref:alpha/beta hydrolase n=1 Tax=Listeria newyorkensis TaxID=1497681 RepID=UPI00066A108C|nr:alpha/beta hydrolase [Listeria newyorkensis]KMT62293.1 hypothetical protein X559_1338 [Listeria newyorkensis]